MKAKLDPESYRLFRDAASRMATHQIEANRHSALSEIAYSEVIAAVSRHNVENNNPPLKLHGVNYSTGEYYDSAEGHGGESHVAGCDGSCEDEHEPLVTNGKKPKKEFNH